MRHSFSLAAIALITLAACTPDGDKIADTLLKAQENTAQSTAIIEAASVALDDLPAQLLIPTSAAHRLMPGELQLAASPDDIPAIFANDALFVDATDGDAEWVDEEEVIGVFLNGEARAYPIRLLSLHEIVNDTVGGEAIAVTWCPLCYSALVFSRVVEGRELTFGVSGFLFHNNLVMYDHQSNTLWSQILAQGIRGGYTKQQLDVLPAIQTTWVAWKSEHPDTLVLSALQMGAQADEIVDPYVGYYTSAAPGLGGQEGLDERLPSKSLVLGIRIAAEKRAYPFDTVRDLALINDELGNLPIVLIYNPSLNSAAAFARLLGERTLTFSLTSEGDTIQDAETRSLWDVESGQAISGELQGEKLSRLTAPIVFWFAWSDIYPDTEIYMPELIGEEE